MKGFPSPMYSTLGCEAVSGRGGDDMTLNSLLSASLYSSCLCHVEQLVPARDGQVQSVFLMAGLECFFANQEPRRESP